MLNVLPLVLLPPLAAELPEQQLRHVFQYRGVVKVTYYGGTLARNLCVCHWKLTVATDMQMLLVEPTTLPEVFFYRPHRTL